MRSSRKNILASLMLFLVLWNGLWGSATMVTFCLHNHGAFHLDPGACEAACESHASQACCDDSSAQLDGPEHCYDFELKASADHYQSGLRGLSVPLPLCVAQLTFDVVADLELPTDVLQQRPPSRAPPALLSWPEQVVAKVVFRL